MVNQYQTIYFCLDDSGKLSSNEKYCTYGGVVFFSKQERDKFITQYKSIINEMKCKYCKFLKCEENCPELKCYNIAPKHRRRIMNYIKKYFVISVIICNFQVYSYVMKDKASKGRYLDYCLRRLIKNVIKEAIKKEKLDSSLPLKIVIEIDEQATKNNGYYNLKEGLKEELSHGIINFDYGTVLSPIVNNEVIVELHYRDSSKTYVVQAADFVAGTARRIVLANYSKENELLRQLSFIDYKIFLP